MIWAFVSLALAFPMTFDGGNAVVSLDGLLLKGQRFSWDGSNLHLDGAVSVAYKELQIESQNLTLYFDEDRQLLSMSVVGAVVLERNDWKGSADKVLWTKKEPWITMHGSANLSNSNLLFQGSRISFSLDTEQVECEADCSIRVKPKK